MAFRELLEGLEGSYPSGTSERYRRLDAYERVLHGTQYEHLGYAFDVEDAGGQYIRIRQRRPSVIFGLASIVVNQVAGLMFGDEQAPSIRCWSQDGNNPFEAVEKAIEVIVDRVELEAAMMEAVEVGSVGSACIVLRALPDKTPWWEVYAGKICRPIYGIKDPRKLIAIVRIYPTKGQDLIDAGYTIVDEKPIAPSETYWAKVELDDAAELCYYPLTRAQYERLGKPDALGRIFTWTLDPSRCSEHSFGVVPAIWIKNDVGSRGIDGPCTFDNVIDLMIEIDYLLSQIGRGFRYTADPMLAISRGELAGQNLAGPIGASTQKDGSGKVVKSASNIIELEEGAKFAMLEIAGTGLEAARTHVKMLREYALEVLGGLKADAEHEKGPQSGRALEMLYESLKLLVKRQRIAYGNRGLLPLLRLIMLGIEKNVIVVPDVRAADVKSDVAMRLVWPQMITPHGSDLLAESQALQLLAGGSMKNPVRLLATDTVTRLAANSTTLTDANQAIAERQAEDDDEALDLAELAEAGVATAPEPDLPPRSAPARQSVRKVQAKKKADDAKAAAAKAAAADKNKPTPSK